MTLNMTIGFCAAFFGNYIGNGHKVLLAAIEADLKEHIKNTKFYCLSMTIIQSSGFGKSRTVDELSKLRFGFIFNLRDYLPGGQFSA
jgi:hypothetical protein